MNFQCSSLLLLIHFPPCLSLLLLTSFLIITVRIIATPSSRQNLFYLPPNTIAISYSLFCSLQSLLRLSLTFFV